MNLVGELVLTRNQILQATSADAGFTMLSRRLDMVTADLRGGGDEGANAAGEPRLLEISAPGARPVAAARQASAPGDGGARRRNSTRSLLEAIKDPLTHSVRNSIDHGIEAPEAA